jgi:hypothetical protein
MPHIYAAIQNGQIVNIILANPSDSFDPSFTWIDITVYSPQPQIGWTTSDNVNFTAPGLPNDAYGNSVTFSTNGTTDTYLVNNNVSYAFPAGTAQAAVYLTIAIKENLAQFQTQIQAYIDGLYSLDLRFNLNAMYNLAVQAGNLPNRVAYITQLFAWAQAIVSYSASYVATVQAMTDPAIVAATSFNPASISVPNPNITPLAAIQINN